MILKVFCPVSLSIIIPTRNRPTALRCVLSYFIHFYPNASIVVADGSSKQYRKANRKIVAQSLSLKRLCYKAYPENLSLISRIKHTLLDITDEFIFISADDDFPVMEALQSAADYLSTNPSYSICGGRSILITLSSDNTYSSRLLLARSIYSESTEQRCSAYKRLQFPTYYCVARREHMLSRLQYISRTSAIGYNDYMIGLHDLTRGKMKILNQLAYIRTANSIHSYIRSNDRLTFLRNAKNLLRFQSLLEADLTASDNVDKESAQRISIDLLLSRINYQLNERGSSGAEHDPAAVKFFENLQDPETALSQQFSSKLESIRGYLKEIVNSSDNADDPRFQSLETNTRQTINLLWYWTWHIMCSILNRLQLVLRKG